MQTLLLILADCQFSMWIGENPILSVVISFVAGAGVTIAGVIIRKSYKNSGIVQNVDNKGTMKESATIKISK